MAAKIFKLLIFFLPASSLLSMADRSLEDMFALCSHPLGMQTYSIGNSQITASSQTSSEPEKYGTQSARLNNKFAWRAQAGATKGEYLQVDFGEVKTVTAIVSQGDNDSSSWVSSFTVKYSLNNDTWEDFQSFTADVDEADKVFTNIFNRPLETRYIRIVPDTWHNVMAMRIELYGCGPTCDNQPVGLENGRISDSQIHASSTLGNSTAANNARLGFTKNDSWCADMDDNSPYLQIDLDALYILCSIATQGNSKADQMVTSYTLQTSLDGSSWSDYKELGQKKVFQGNYQSSVISKHYFEASPVCRYIRVLPTNYIGAACMRVEFYGVQRTTCNNAGVGIALPHIKVPNYRMTASREWPVKYTAFAARLNDERCWEPLDNNDDNDFVQIDLGDPYILCGIAMQETGQSFRIDERTTSFGVRFSMDGKTWTNYSKTLPGNLQKAYPLIDIVKNAFDDIQVAKFVRIYPVTYENYKCVKTELFGLRQAWKGAFGLETLKHRRKIPDVLFTASSALDDDHVASKARLYGDDAWCPSQANDSFIQIVFLKSIEVFGIAIQGDTSSSKWVTKYDFQYGNFIDEMTTIPNIDTQLVDNKEVTVHWLSSPVPARVVRILPTAWNNYPCMRIELFISKRAPPARITSLYAVGNMVSQNGSYVSMNCTASGDDFMHIKWFLGGSDVTGKSSGSVYSNHQKTSQLQVNFTSYSDMVASYSCGNIDSFKMNCTTTVSCQAGREGGNGDRREHLLQVIVDREIQVISSEISGRLRPESGSFVIAKCVATGDEAVHIKWYFGNKDITNSSQGSSYNEDKVTSYLQVNFTSFIDVNSNYNCEEIEGFRLKCNKTLSCQGIRGNITGEKSNQIVEVFMYRQHEITSFGVISKYTTKSGTFITVQCIASGDSSAEMKWLLGNRDVTDLSRGISFLHDEISSQLQVNFTDVPDGPGCRYTCRNITVLRSSCTALVSCRAFSPMSKQAMKNHTIEALMARVVLAAASKMYSYVSLVALCCFLGVLIEKLNSS